MDTEGTMKVFILACAAALVVAIGSYYVLEGYQQNAESAYSSRTGVRT